MTRRILWSTIVAMSTASAAFAGDFTAGDIKIHDPRIFEKATTGMAAGGYMLIENTGASDDALMSVQADFPRVELHTTVENDGVARMMPVEAVPLPAGGTALLEPGGLHVMFMGLNGVALSAGDTVDATLVFENAGTVDIQFEVQPR